MSRKRREGKRVHYYLNISEKAVLAGKTIKKIKFHYFFYFKKYFFSTHIRLSVGLFRKFMDLPRKERKMRRTSPFLSTLAIAVCGALLCAPLHAFGGEEGLYPAAPPPGSAFIRFFNGNDHTPAAVKIRGKSYGAASFGNISQYAPVPQGDVDLSIGGESASSHLKEGAYYTALLVKGKLSVLEEPANDNKIKAQIVLINASSTSNISLKTSDGSTGIVDGVDTLKLGSRSVNAVKVPFSVYASNNKIGDLDAHLLERGARYAVVVYDGLQGKPAVTFN